MKDTFICRYWLLLALLSGVAVQSHAQLPDTDLYMISYSHVDTQFNIKQISYLTGFNPDGYNNQPYFINADELYISTDYWSSGSPEVAKLNLDDQTIERMTISAESDFSPMPLPMQEGISTVRIEADGFTQSLWAYNTDNFDPGARLLQEIDRIGYYSWLSEEEVAAFLLPEPFTLNIFNLETGDHKIILDNIGRCFKQDDGGNLLFTHLVNGSIRYIKKYDVETGNISVVCQALEGSEDFELIPGGAILMARGDKVYYFDTDTSTSWHPVMDLSHTGIVNISRLSVSRGKIVLVSSSN